MSIPFSAQHRIELTRRRSHHLVMLGQLGETWGVKNTSVTEIIHNTEELPDAEVTVSNRTRMWRKRVALKGFAGHPWRKVERCTDASSIAGIDNS